MVDHLRVMGDDAISDLVPPPWARQRIAELVQPGAPIWVSTPDAGALILATAVTAPIDLPRFRNAAMDGFSVALERMVPEAGTTVASDAWPIATGQRVPDEADTVIPLERATEIAPHQIRISGPIDRGANIRSAGEELHAGERALEAGSLLGPAAMGLLAALGVDEVEVIPRPRVGILVTGDELRTADPGAGTPIAPNEINDANGPMLRALVAQAGYAVSVTLRTGDDASAVSASLASLAEQCDLILTSGGASVGRRDHVARALEADGQIVLRQLALRPGRPTCFGYVAGTPLVVLPGNPLALLIGYEVIGRPALRRLAGHRRVMRPTVRARFDARVDVRPDRWEAVPVLLLPESDVVVAVPAAKRRAGMLAGAAGADGLVLLAPGTDAPAEVNVELWSE
jgi:molybdopterin molybdotransferase